MRNKAGLAAFALLLLQRQRALPDGQPRGHAGILAGLENEQPLDEAVERHRDALVAVGCLVGELTDAALDRRPDHRHEAGEHDGRERRRDRRAETRPDR